MGFLFSSVPSITVFVLFGKDYVGYSIEVFKPVYQAADESMDVPAVCEFHVYGSGGAQYHHEDVKLAYSPVSSSM